MTGSFTSPPEIENLGELLVRLGNIAPERIRFNPPPGTATVEDVLSIERRENRLCELVDGVLVEKVMGYAESWIAAIIANALNGFVLPRDLGAVTGPDGMIRFPNNLVRMPDVAFAFWHRFPDGKLPDEGAPEIVPDLAVEVLSKGNTTAEMQRKLHEYFAAGVQLVWFVDPKSRKVTVYRTLTQAKVVAEDGVLDGGKVLPGFKLPVASLFAKLKAARRKRR